MGEKPIPNRLVFVWFGERFPITARVAVRSAMHACRPDETLIVSRDLDPANISDLLDEGAAIQPAGPHWFEDLPAGGDVARRLFSELASPAARSNLLRLAVLWKLGGIYLDTDTITLRDLAPLRRFRGFCGLEPVAIPGDLFGTRNPVRWMAAGVKLALREGCARLESGVRLFRLIERVYTPAVNNAVVGSCPGNALVARAFDEIASLEPVRRRRRYKLGTHLLQRLTGNRSSPDMEVLDPAYFYPLGPEISAHWFRDGSADRLQDLLRPETHVVHWYSSVEERVGIGRIDEQYIRSSADSVAFSKIAAPHLG